MTGERIRKAFRLLRFLLYFTILFALVMTADHAVFFGQGDNKGLQDRGPFEAGIASFDIDSGFFEKMLPAHQIKKSPGPFDWLAHNPEPGQTFDQYLLSNPVVPDKYRKTIYIVMLGDFDEKRREIVRKTAVIIEEFYQLEVRFLSPLPLSVVPESARRQHPQTGDKQFNTRAIIEDILIPLKPADAFCLIAFTSSDLWPAEGWNFVFGEASLYDRVGIWSIYRNGDPYESQEAYDLCLMRTVKTGLHEIGHMFSMLHCIYFECLMNGSNHRKESDERPVWLCPVCLRKLSWALKMDEKELRQRFKNLQYLFEGSGFRNDRDYYQHILEVF